jgi:ubiquinol-cytochrome c reductase cytochrome b subunit
LLERLAPKGTIIWMQNLEVPCDALIWMRFSGALALVLVVLLFVSGAIMTLYYSPFPGAAYDSVDYAQYNVPFGDMIRGVHYYAWNLLLVVIVLHLGRVFVAGAYKAPCQMVWISGVLVMSLVPAFIITGDLLPWNQWGYWSTQVRLSIISSVPLVGDFLAQLVRGGPYIGIVALTRFYVLHTLFLPCLFVVLLAVHLGYIVSSQRAQYSSLVGDAGAAKSIRVVPDMVNRWLVLFLVVTITLGVVSSQRPAPLGDPADPSDASFMPKPEWWVLFLNRLVTTFKGPWMVFGTVLIPGGLVGLLFALPFLDRSAERHPTHRKATMLVAAILVVGLLGLSIMGYIEHYIQAW